MAYERNFAMSEGKSIGDAAWSVRALRVLSAASADLVRDATPQDVLVRLIEGLVEGFQERCVIALGISPKEDQFEDEGQAVLRALWVASELGLPFTLGHRFALSQHDALRRASALERLTYVPALRESDWWPALGPHEREGLALYGLQAALIAPLWDGERVLGLALLGFRRPLPEPLDVSLGWARVWVNHATALASNARLRQQLADQHRELSRTYTELQEIHRLRTELIQNVSHELRTPLSLIQGYAELMVAEELGPLQDSQREALQVIRERTGTLTRLLQNLSMLQAIPGEVPVLRVLHLTPILRRVLDDFRRAAARVGVTLAVHVPEGLPPVLGDRERLKLAFEHLVDNAVKFSPDGGTVTLEAWSDEHSVYVSVQDEGVGIPAEHLDRIFERFYQVNGTTTRRFGGMGVGLALVWEIVQSHSGKIEVTSEPGQGTTFTVTLLRA